ncbi:unnamed protein product [Ectocarpus sp. 12 AP-2014]
MFRQDITCPVLLDFTRLRFRIRGYHPLWRHFPEPSPTSWLVPVRSPLLRESRLISFPRGT